MGSNVGKAYDIYLSEKPSFDKISNFFSDLEAQILYGMVRLFKPKTILDFAPREGKSTSAILAAIQKNLQENKTEITYVISEKDSFYLKEIKKYTSNYKDINFLYFKNIISNFQKIQQVGNFDFLFIDANHDYILSQWYIDNLFPLVDKNPQGLIHVHDIMHDVHGTLWNSVGFEHNPQTHEDIIDVSTVKKLYPTIYNKYKNYIDDPDVIDKFEEDVIKKWFANQSWFAMESTAKTAREHDIEDKGRSCYFFRKLMDV